MGKEEKEKGKASRERMGGEKMGRGVEGTRGRGEKGGHGTERIEPRLDFNRTGKEKKGNGRGARWRASRPHAAQFSCCHLASHHPSTLFD